MADSEWGQARTNRIESIFPRRGDVMVAPNLVAVRGWLSETNYVAQGHIQKKDDVKPDACKVPSLPFSPLQNHLRRHRFFVAHNLNMKIDTLMDPFLGATSTFLLNSELA